MKQLIIRILVLNVANKGAGGLVPTLEIPSRQRHQAITSRELNGLNVLFGNVSHTTVIDPRKFSS